MKAINRVEKTLEEIKEAHLWKDEISILGAQSREVETEKNGPLINYCANNYLGLSNHPRIIEAAKKALDSYGFGLSSVRFICGRQDQHVLLEQELSNFLGTEDTILFSSCFDANGGVFEALLGESDFIYSDSLNHASIIDGIRLSKAGRRVFPHADLAKLEMLLQQDRDAAETKDEESIRLIVTDGVFSMDGVYAPLKELEVIAREHDALLMVDDSHAVGFVGETGRGTHQWAQLDAVPDIITGTLGKALGGASGGYVSGRKQIIDLLRQRARPYLFSNSLAPPIVAASREALRIVDDEPERREQLWKNTDALRTKLKMLGLLIPSESHPIIPVILGEAEKAQGLAQFLLEKGIFVTAFSYPVVPQGKARIRIQVSAHHSEQDIDLLGKLMEQYLAQ